MQVITLIHYLVISGIEVYYSNYFQSKVNYTSYTIVGSMNTLAHYMLGVFLGFSCKYQPTGLLRISIVHLLAITLHIHTFKCPMN